MAAAGVLSHPVRSSFDSYRPLDSPLTNRSYTRAAPPTNSVMSQSLGVGTPPPPPPPPPPQPLQNDNSRVALPSISNLLGIADGSSSDKAQASRDPTYHYNSPHSKRPAYEPAYGQKIHSAENAAVNTYAPQDGNAPSSYTRYSPLVDASQAAASYAMEIDQVGANALKRQSAQSYDQPSYSTKPYAASPSAVSDGSVYSPNTAIHRQIGPYGSSAVQAGFQPSGMSTPNLPATNPWEHHHYIGAASQQGIYAHLPDRYICQTCNKAFSRPSSLKIHSHSHTGEKPFKCPHAGCNKAFSVKSNMKRHEKGCHSGNGQAMPGAYISEDQS